MPNYQRIYHRGGMYFFTVNLQQRNGNDLLVSHIDLLRAVVKRVRQRHPFAIHGWVVLPDHLHCLLQLPPGDSDHSCRWQLIKAGFAKSLPYGEHRCASRRKRGERGIWQRRYWEHLIRDERDYLAHLDYIHINPLKHGLVERVVDWPYSTFHRWVRAGVYSHAWADGGAAGTLPYTD